MYHNTNNESTLSQQDRGPRTRPQQTSHRGHVQSAGHEPLRAGQKQKQDSARRKEDESTRPSVRSGEVISGRDRGGFQRALPLKRRE